MTVTTIMIFIWDANERFVRFKSRCGCIKVPIGAQYFSSIVESRVTRMVNASLISSSDCSCHSLM